MMRREAMRLLAGAGAAVVASRSGWAAGPQQAAPQTLLPLFPLGIVLLPGNNVPLHIFEPRYREMMQECIKGDLEFGVLLMQGDAIEPVGCTARVVDLIHRYRDGQFDVLIHGERRFRIGRHGEQVANSLTEDDFNTERAFFRGLPVFVEDESPAPGGAGDNENAELIAQAMQLRTRLNTLVAADDPQSMVPKQKLPLPSNPQLSFHLMNGLPADAVWKQDLLELRVERERLVRVVLHLQQLIQYMEDDPENPSPRQVA